MSEQEHLPVSVEAEKPRAAEDRGAALATGSQEQAAFEQAGTEYQLQYNSQNLGWLGKFFGAGSNAPTNIAGLVTGVCLLILSLTFVLSFFVEVKQPTQDMQKGLLGVLLTALGYILGANSKK